MPKTELRLDLLGTSLPLSISDEDPAYLESLRACFTQKVEDVQRIYSGNPLETALLAGFLLCDELERLRASPPAIEPGDALQLEQITLGLIEKIDRAFPDDFEERQG